MENLEKLLSSENLNDSIIEIFYHIVNIYKEDQEEEYVEKLNAPQRNFYFNQCFEIEVNNGGISQYFFKICIPNS